ncbi:MAG: aminotransferase class I/II-fold pyridoxal phosphate-dependent enzyme [Gammaproteobacteria bacterium]
MPLERITYQLLHELAGIEASGASKRHEPVITQIVPAAGTRGPRYLIEGQGERLFLRMNSNGYLGMALRQELIDAEESAVRAFGSGPGAVRFISGTYAPHIELERRLAAFHGREAAMIFSSAYATVMGVLPTFITPETAVISDALNHNCIINATRLAHPKEKHVYAHLNMVDLESCLARAAAACQRAIVVTDGIFSMRGDHAPLAHIKQIAARFDARYTDNVVVLVDDSHGVGAIGATGRGTEEHTGAGPCDILIATLGKALGVNGGYVVADRVLIDYLREKAPLYIYSNPITPGEAAAAVKALDLLDSPTGSTLLRRLRQLTVRFRQGLTELGYEVIAGEHPVVPLLLRDTARTHAMVQHLRSNGVLATGLSYPVVPRGEEEIRFQISADHTEDDLDEVLAVIAAFPARGQ